MCLLVYTFLLMYRSQCNASIWNSHLAKHKCTVCGQIQNRKLLITSLDCVNLNIIPGNWSLFWGLWTMCFMYVCLEWPLLCSLSASADEKWASCLQNSLPCDPFAIGSHTAGKVSQVHPLLLATVTLFDEMIRVFICDSDCFHGLYKSAAFH